MNIPTSHPNITANMCTFWGPYGGRRVHRVNDNMRALGKEVGDNPLSSSIQKPAMDGM